MNDSTSDFDLESSRSMSAFLPLALLGVTLAMVLVFQVSILLPQRTLLQQALTQNEVGVQQSKQVQAGLQRLVMDLVNSAADDKDAQAIIAKYGIQVTGNPAAAAASPKESPASK